MNKSAISAFPGAIKQLLKRSELYCQTVSGGQDSPQNSGLWEKSILFSMKCMVVRRKWNPKALNKVAKKLPWRHGNAVVKMYLFSLISNISNVKTPAITHLWRLLAKKRTRSFDRKSSWNPKIIETNFSRRLIERIWINAKLVEKPDKKLHSIPICHPKQ